MSVFVGGFFDDAKERTKNAYASAKESALKKKASACKGKVTKEVYKKILDMARASNADIVTVSQLEFLKSTTKNFGCQTNTDDAFDKLIELAESNGENLIKVADVQQDFALLHIGAGHNVHFMTHDGMVNFHTGH